MKKYSMLTDSPGKSLFFFALPMILGNLFQQFYSTVDSIIVGQFVGEDALAAVGASYSLTTVFIMIAIGGGIGASVITSQYLGAALYKKMKTSVSTALITFLVVSVILGGFGLFFSRSILMMLNTPGNIMEDAILYLKIYFVGLPFLFMYNILSSIFNALGNSKTPLYLLIFSSLLNIVLDLFLVGVLGFGIAGAAVATVFAQGLSAVISFCILVRILKLLSYCLR
ncbi:MAG: polysaccharide biosynthesis C-terminal domain-containing protein, partial [Lachnospiraceae bacterium]|nr:polysaccharide biosynthesis C-terminal domain-containing protein [Lachnospiraceae bacterium]